MQCQRECRTQCSKNTPALHTCARQHFPRILKYSRLSTLTTFYARSIIDMLPALLLIAVSIWACVKNTVAIGGETSTQVDPKQSTWKNWWARKSIGCERTNWMHTAKTGSTFCLAIQHVCCPAAFENLTSGITTEMLALEEVSYAKDSKPAFEYQEHYCYKFLRAGYEPMNCTFAGRPDHIALQQHADLTTVMGLLMVREPKTRIISAFLDNVHLEGFVNKTFGREMKRQFNVMDLDTQTPWESILLKKAQIYARHRSLYGHQVKMLLGLPVMDLSRPHPQHIKAVVALAVEKLRQFFFVGIFDEYARSLRLFHELANVGTTPTAVELFPQRRTSAADKAFLMEHLVYDDPYDTLLYQTARKIFQEELDFVKLWKNVTL